MNEGDAIDLVQSAIWMVVVGAGPCVGAAMAVGVVIALLQALTQIQEMTLTFVPKMIAVFVAASLTASFVGGKFSIFTQSRLCADRAGVQVAPQIRRSEAPARSGTSASSHRAPQFGSSPSRLQNSAAISQVPPGFTVWHSCKALRSAVARLGSAAPEMPTMRPELFS